MSEYPSSRPNVRVGILLTDQEVKVVFHGIYHQHGRTLTGEHTFSRAEGLFTASSEDCFFEVKDVVIGVGFHWERKENQCFSGDLELIEIDNKLQVVNILPVESYLKSVISSEMSATASIELLKAHAVISRSWLLAQIYPRKGAEKPASTVANDEEYIKWYDHDDHDLFDVCADDHCQRYQGITRQTTPKVDEAVDATMGLVLTDTDGSLCDARFSKCCGGVFEEFESCWEPTHYNYLIARRDNVDPLDFPNLRIEAEAQRWIDESPEAFCNTTDPEILSQVLNNYDQETTDFYRWHVSYTQEELSELIKKRSGIDFGRIIDLEPVERGTSGRLIKMRVRGTAKTLIIGKELEIRRILSTSHLYSSAFTVERHDVDASTGIPASFTLHGAGWGHGVGLCQIGAAVMGARGYSYIQILNHYYPGANLTPLYS